jgi:hypothetical protein
MKEAFIKRKLNAGIFVFNQWHEVDYANEVNHAGTFTVGG